jgi:hypothetical protein
MNEKEQPERAAPFLWAEKRIARAALTLALSTLKLQGERGLSCARLWRVMRELA